MGERKAVPVNSCHALEVRALSLSIDICGPKFSSMV